MGIISNMEAIVLKRYGSVQNLKLEKVPKPIPAANEVLVKVHSAAVNDWDWCLVRGTPIYIRLLYGLFNPKIKIPGVDMAGTVEAVGENVTTFKAGDAVYGDLSNNGFGAFAEYVCIPANTLTLKPHSMTFMEAAALPHAAMLAMQGLIDLGKINAAKKLLVNGAGGGVGTLAAQLARAHGCTELTGVDSAEKAQTMLQAGFKTVLDYKRVNFTRTGKQYDLILDTRTTLYPASYRRALKRGGSYVTVGGHTGKLLRLALWAAVSNRFSSKHLKILALKPNKNLTYINELYIHRKLKPLIDDKRYSLSDTPEAIEHFGTATHTGKIVINIA